MTVRPEHEDALAGEAAAWVVRLAQADAGEADWLAFAAWIDVAPDLRRAAFDRAQAVWLETDALATVPQAPAGRRRWRTAGPARGRRQPRAALAAAAAAAVAGIVLAVGLERRLSAPPAPTQEPVAAATVFVTAPGHRRSLRLADGSRVEMDGGSELRIASASGRQVVLQHGEALFDVVHDAARPFTVSAGAMRVRVLGTAFDVERDGATDAVAVMRGAVRASTERSAVRVAAGESARVTPAGGLQLTHVSLADVGAWRQDRRLYLNRPLAEVVADLNRRYPQPVRLSGEATGRMRFTGVLVLGPNRADTLRRLTALLPLSAQAGRDGAVVLSSAPR